MKTNENEINEPVAESQRDSGRRPALRPKSAAGQKEGRKRSENYMKLELPSLSENESMARTAVGAFISQLSPTLAELADIKCAVSEAVTNAVVHAYRGTRGTIIIAVKLYADRVVRIDVRDTGCGIDDVEAAMQPLYTTDPAGERSGMGFAVMESFTDKLRVKSKPGKGTTVTMIKKLSKLK